MIVCFLTIVCYFGDGKTCCSARRNVMFSLIVDSKSVKYAIEKSGWLIKKKIKN